MNIFSLKWRGAILVLFPLACLVFLVVVLLHQFQQIQDFIIEQNNSRIFVTRCYALESQIVEAFCDLSTTSDNQGLVNQQNSLGEFNSIKTKLYSVVESSRGNPSRLKQAIAIQTFWNAKAAKFIDWFLAAQSHGEQYWKVVNHDFPIKLLALCDEFLSKFTDLIMSERSKLSPEKTIAQWSALRQVPYIAMGASALLAICLGVAYALTIKSPLSRISENCRRLAARETLLPPLRGRDELSELDRLFHALAENYHGALDKEKAMIDNARDMICSLSSEGKFLKTNNSSLSLLSFESDELIGRSLIDVCTVDDMARADEEIQTSCSRNDMRTFELTLARKDGSPVDTRWSCVWSDRDNALFAVVHDISEEKNIERLKQDFVDMISHDLRSPLTSMLGSLSMIEQGAKGPLPKDAQSEIESAVRNVERLVEFINDLLDFQKLKAGRMQLDINPCKMEEIIAEAIDMVKSSADAKGLTIILPKDTATTNGDRHKLNQVTVNLIANAIRFAPPDSAIEIELQSQNDSVEMRVIDHGPGVPLEYRELIFDAFQQVPSQKSQGGTGLGLAICKLIVDAHGGEIGVYSSQDDVVKPAISFSKAATMDKTSTDCIFWIKLPKV